jgi:nicotinamide mononucleotide transporter
MDQIGSRSGSRRGRRRTSDADVIGALLSRYTNAALPWLDSATTTTSLIAQWMMARKILENWIVWVAVDVVYIGMFLYKSLFLTALLYAAFLVLAVTGYFQWKRSLPPAPDGFQRES